jgi:hypothetical protein
MVAQRSALGTRHAYVHAVDALTGSMIMVFIIEITSTVSRGTREAAALPLRFVRYAAKAPPEV